MSKPRPQAATRSRFFILTAFISVLALISVAVVFAAISLSTSTAYTQNFDGIGTSATATLPTDWKVDKPSTVRTVGTFAAATTTTNFAGGANLSSSASNGIYNFGSGTTTTGPDRAVGFLSSGTATQSGNLYAQLVNNTGGSLSGIQISYDVEKYRNGSNPNGFRIQMFYSADGNSWTSAGSDFLTSFASDANNNGFATAPGGTVSVTNKTLNVSVANGANLYLAWNYSVAATTTTTNAQALAIDNVSILGISAGGSTNPTGVGNANPSSVPAGSQTLLTVAVAPGNNPTSTGLAVTGNLSLIGGSATQQFYDDGTHGDVTAGDNTFSFQATVASNTSGGAKSLPVTITDAQARTGNTTISLTVLVPTPPSGTGAANPSSVQAGNSSLLTVNVTPGSNPTSTGLGVTGDLSSIGGSSTQQFYDDGTHGDVTAGNNVFSFSATVSNSTPIGTKTLPITITDAQSRTGNTSITLDVQSAPPAAGSVVISQIYGGGGNSGATFKNDFIEIFNRSSNTVSLLGWSVQYASAAGTTWQKTDLTGTLAPGQYYLIQEAAGMGGSTDLPTPIDATGTINMSATNGKVALVFSNTALSGGCPIGNPQLIDFIGYGTADCFEGPSAAPQLSNTTAALRARNGCKDTDYNGVNFTEVAPSPRNSSSPFNVCPAGDEAPEVFSTSPASGATNVSLTSNITINFDQLVNVTGSWFQISCATSGIHTAPYTGGPTSFTIDPDMDFAGNEQCTVTVFASQVNDQDTEDPPDNMAADYVFSFRTLIPRDPAEHLVMGNPTGAVTDVNQPTNYLLAKQQYAVSYNRDRGGPNWVSWHLDSSWLGTAPRQDDFRADDTLPAAWYHVQGSDFSGSGFDRGHMCPSADRTSSIPDNSATFLMTNMVPQAPDNNQGPWADLENDLRVLIGQGKELYIISGGQGTGGTGSGGFQTTITGGNVTVPAKTWKVIIVLSNADGNDVARVDSSTRTFAVIMPNMQGIRNDDWRKYLATVDQVEALTGDDFFSNVAPEIQAPIESRLDDANDTAPVADGQTGTTAEDTSKQFTLTASDFNVNNVLSFTIVTGPSHGNLGSLGASSCSNGNCTATVTYTPGTDYNGSDSFTFRVNDGDKDSGTATVTIGVTEVNDSPVAINDAKTADQDGSSTFPAGDLTANDSAGPSNESSQTLTVTSVTSTPNTHGAVTLNSGTVSYHAEADYNGTASFDYQVCDNGTTSGSADPKCATGTVFVTVNDTTAPIITCPADTTVSCDASTDPSATGTATATDNRGTATVTHSDVTTPGSSAGNYTITRTWTATDANGNTSTCTQTITVQDTTPPAISCPADTTVSCDTSTEPTATGTATATDSCSTATVTYSDAVTPGACAGSYTITRTWTGTDASGNSSSCAQTITVVDTTPPVITCPADVTVSCAASTDPSALGMATATDNCSGVTVTFTDTVTPGSSIADFTITRHWVATDGCGNSSSCDQVITVRDTTPPTITCPADATVSCDASSDPSATGTATATDNCSTATVSYSDVTTPGSSAGNYTITRTWTATDASGNSSSCTQTITVRDTTAPTISCPANIVTVTDPGQCSAVVNFTPTATDNCSDVTIVSNPPSGSVFPKGTTTVTSTATDAAGNSSSCSFTVTVNDTEKPIITCPANIVTSNDPGQCSAVVNYTVTATDNCPGVTVVSSPPSGS
ncbi:MAG TPA: DNA/RNA non-specific endonuclease, partial [Pyrinomonadaceae bacterium]